MKAVGLHPRGIISPICHEICTFSSAICQCGKEIFSGKKGKGSSASTWLSVLQPRSNPLPLSIVCCAHISVTAHKPCIVWYTEVILLDFNKLTFSYITQFYRPHRKRQKYVFSFFCHCFVFWPSLCALRNCVQWKSVCIFTFMVFNIHCCLGLQQQ